MKRFKDKVAVVTGGANGLGEAIVRRLVEEGAKVAVVDVEEDRVQEVCASMPEDTFGVVTDVGFKDQVDDMVKKVVDKYGRIDLLFNNAAKMSYYEFLELPEEEWDEIHRTNLKGIFLVGQAVAKSMADMEIPGRIVNTASIASDTVTPTTAAYASSKGAIMQLTKVMALDLSKYSIRVNCIGPGAMMTRMTSRTRQNPAKVASFMDKLTEKRFAAPEEVAGVALFLASDDASYISGSIYFVDGGWRIM